MVFNSFQFFGFFACLIILYGFLKEKQRFFALLAFSIAFFFSFGSFWAFFYILFTALSSYLCTLGMEKEGTSEKRRKVLLILCLLSNFGILCVVKYFNFFAGSVSSFFNRDYSDVSFIIPVGISFYTFQMMGYTIDVYRKITVPERNFLKLFLFASYFPQMIDGPISRYNDVSEKLFHPAPIEYERCRDALILFAWGLFKKICVADNLKILVDLVFGDFSDGHGIIIMAGAVGYAIYIYADFSGCIDMARGISSFFGVELKNNFERPYFAASVEEFWRKWHITLSLWFRDYLFYPLLRSNGLTGIGRAFKKKGFKKASKAIPTIIALLVVWLTTGLWHGASLTFVVWGLYYGSFMILGVLRDTLFKKRTKSEEEKKSFSHFLKVLITFVIVSFGYILFNASTFEQAVSMFENLFDLRHFIEPGRIFSLGVSFFKRVGGGTYLTVTVSSVIVMVLYDLARELGADPLNWIKRRLWIVKYVFSVGVMFLLLFLMNRSAGDCTYMRFYFLTNV